MNEINLNCAPPCTELLLMQKDITNINEKLESALEKLDALDSKLDQKYAPMITWQIMKYSGAIIGAALLAAILKVILVP